MFGSKDLKKKKKGGQIVVFKLKEIYNIYIKKTRTLLNLSLDFEKII